MNSCAMPQFLRTKNPMTLDVETYLKVSVALQRCQRTGWDPAEELDRLGLILSPAQQCKLQDRLLGQLLELLSNYRPVELLRRKYHPGAACSPAEMYVVMMEFIEEYRTMMREQA